MAAKRPQVSCHILEQFLVSSSVAREGTDGQRMSWLLLWDPPRREDTVFPLDVQATGQSFCFSFALIAVLMAGSLTSVPYTF